MTALEIITVILAVISIIAGITFGINSLRSSVERAKLKILAEQLNFATVIRSGKASMKEDLSDMELEVITRIVSRDSAVPLVHILSNLQERTYLFQALADPSKYPWEKRDPDKAT